MARSRNIKPAFFKNEQLAELPFEARLLFIGLWTLADREGRLEDRPKRIRMEVFPADNVDVDVELSKLQESGFITRYTAGESRFIEVCNFIKHQTPHHKEAPSTIPEPKASTVKEGAAPPSQGRQTHLIPDSLIPSSLIPDSPIPDSGKPAALRAEADPEKQEIWTIGKAMLGKEGASFLGKLVKDYGQKLVLQAIRDCKATEPVSPKEWLVARCQERRANGAGLNKQRALEERNHRALENWQPPADDAPR